MNDATPEAFYMEYRPGLRLRLRNRLFPRKRCPHAELPGGTGRDGIRISTVVVISWADRLRLLLTGRLMVETDTETENLIGEHATNSVAYVLAPRETS